MTIDPLLDTIMNVNVFVFIGLMVWLYFKEAPGRHDGDTSDERDDSAEN